MNDLVVRPKSDRELLHMLKDNKRKFVQQKVVSLSTWRQYQTYERELNLRIKESENEKPRSPA